MAIDYVLYYIQCSPEPLWDRGNVWLPGLFRCDLRIYGPFLLNFKALSCSIHPFLPLYLSLAFYHLRDPMTILEPWGKKRHLSWASLFACLVTVGLTFRWHDRIQSLISLQQRRQLDLSSQISGQTPTVADRGRLDCAESVIVARLFTGLQRRGPVLIRSRLLLKLPLLLQLRRALPPRLHLPLSGLKCNRRNERWLCLLR
ncbi:hypothetical protein C8J56DRAFT_1164050 [Mycena floridula]|nr:hypothetical protein C8J56DRAFT_1164050 [Mycena floridula]